MENKKGKKGFIKQPENELRNKRISIYLNELEMEKMIKFAKENNKSYTEIIRGALKDIIKQ
tara:strand:- start:1061 stop:1243 length:183 start_codon:yes stop_codon:yes gene_type:complete